VIFTTFSPLANHLWQSSLFVAFAWLLALLLRKNRAAARYWIWFASSVKFLIPFSLLVNAGSHIEWRTAPAFRQSQVSVVIDEFSQPFALSAQPVRPLRSQTPNDLPEILLLGIWFCGFTIGVIFWLRWSQRIRAAQRAAKPLRMNLPVPVMSSAAQLEPGVFGVFSPVILLPEGITERLTPDQLGAVLAHELCHLRRKDNLTAAVHMIVEGIFWFHPLLWWIRARLVEERERACDEEVLKQARDPQVYVEGILNVCKFCLEVPPVCAASITGANLKTRVEQILTNRIPCELSRGRKLILTVIAMSALVVPIAIGIANGPTLYAQPGPLQASPAFEVASVKRNKNGGQPRLRYSPSGVDFASVPLMWIIGEAYQVPYARISSSDSHINDSFFSPAGTAYFYDIAARAAHSVPKAEIRLMLRALLENRFKLVLHHEPKTVSVYKLLVVKNPKLHESAPDGEPSGTLGLDGFVCHNLEMARFASMLSVHMDRPVVDLTGLQGIYDFTLKSSLPGASEKAALAEWFSSAIFTDIQRQLGLRLEAGKAAVDYVVVDRVEQPSEN
jgi:bla regulator protein blaR1